MRDCIVSDPSSNPAGVHRLVGANKEHLLHLTTAFVARAAVACAVVEFPSKDNPERESEKRGISLKGTGSESHVAALRCGSS